MDGQRCQLWCVELVLTPPDVGVWWGGEDGCGKGRCVFIMSKIELPLWVSE